MERHQSGFQPEAHDEESHTNPQYQPGLEVLQALGHSLKAETPGHPENDGDAEQNES